MTFSTLWPFRRYDCFDVTTVSTLWFSTLRPFRRYDHFDVKPFDVKRFDLTTFDDTTFDDTIFGKMYLSLIMVVISFIIQAPVIKASCPDIESYQKSGYQVSRYLIIGTMCFKIQTKICLNTVCPDIEAVRLLNREVSCFNIRKSGNQGTTVIGYPNKTPTICHDWYTQCHVCP